MNDEHLADWELEIRELRADLLAAADALRVIGKAALVVKPTLEQPYRDEPRTNPWKRFMEVPTRNAYNLGVQLHRKLKEDSEEPADA